MRIIKEGHLVEGGCSREKSTGATGSKRVNRRDRWRGRSRTRQIEIAGSRITHIWPRSYNVLARLRICGPVVVHNAKGALYDRLAPQLVGKANAGAKVVIVVLRNLSVGGNDHMV